MAVTNYWFLTYTITAGVQTLIVLICGLWLAFRTVYSTYGDICHVTFFQRKKKTKSLPMASEVYTDKENTDNIPEARITTSSLQTKPTIQSRITSSIPNRRGLGTMARHYTPV